MMAGWTTVLAADPTEWLLEESNPSIRYLTLKNIFDRRDADPAVQRAKAEIMRTALFLGFSARESERVGILPTASIGTSTGARSGSSSFLQSTRQMVRINRFGLRVSTFCGLLKIRWVVVSPGSKAAIALAAGMETSYPV
jgi:hypothetical protein